ncbi:unnamed protein product [Amoebophrya sp. A120]|nr:unnamed protein product [Amoebophrya sp. A120]|eukprot:GSA120T00020575001.1
MFEKKDNLIRERPQSTSSSATRGGESPAFIMFDLHASQVEVNYCSGYRSPRAVQRVLGAGSKFLILHELWHHPTGIMMQAFSFPVNSRGAT